MRNVDHTPYNATVIGREEINPRILILRVRPQAPLFDFAAGQFAVLGLLAREPRVPFADPEDPPPKPDKLIRRAYSIASSSVQKEYLEFYINLVPSGELTPRLFHLKHDSRIFLSPKPSGVFTLDRVPPDKDVFMVATGTGLAPYMSMLRTHLRIGTGRQFVILHGARYSWDLGYRGELETLARLLDNFTYIPSITRPRQDPYFRGPTGRVQTLLEDGVLENLCGLQLDPELLDVFLCGNPAMIEEVTKLLTANGFVPDRGKVVGTIHTEKYW